jgi:aminobenzoyl-glutamate utilization protein B
MCPATVSRLALALACLAAPASSAPAETVRLATVLDKGAMLRGIEERAEETWRAALDLWEWAEPGYQETRSAERLAAQLEQRGFRVERGVADIPTAFVASFGSGEPVLGILAEFDALPGLSQEAVPERRPRTGGDYGHGCGHHLFGAASVAAAIAVADALESGALEGTIRLFGTPAEEGGGAKIFLVRSGLFEGVDAVLHWHPADRNAAGDPTNMARVAAKFRFRGRSAHAAASPEQGRSALDAVELMNHAAQLLREHTPDRTRIHHVITAGGRAPNVVPDFAEVYYYVRHPDAAVARDLYRRLLLCAQGAATATETELEVEYLGGTHNILPNDTLARVSLRNLRELADIVYDDAEADFARRLQATLERPRPLDDTSRVHDQSGETSSGSTDVGDVSWVVPTTGVDVATWVPGTPAHSWQAVAAGGTTIGRKGMLLAARTLAAVAWDLFRDPEILAAARAELRRRLEESGYRYQPMLERDQPPPLDYRDSPGGG